MHRSRLSLALAATLLPLVAVAAWAAPAPTIVITSPLEPRLENVRPTFSVAYSSDPTQPLDLASLRITVDGVDWTDRFTKTSTEATYAVEVQDSLVAGDVVLRASIAALNGETSSAERAYEIIPTFQALTPAVGRPGDTIRIAALGLDRTASQNQLRFPSAAGSGSVEVPLADADPAAGIGTVEVPEDALSGNVFLTTNGKTANLSFYFERAPDFESCGQPRKLLALPDGSLLVIHAYYSYVNGSTGTGTDCPVLTGSISRRSVVTRHWPDGTITLVKDSNSVTRHNLDIAVPKDGSSDYAVVVLETTGYPSYAVQALAIHYRDNVTRIPADLLDGDISDSKFSQRLITDFDGAGNLYLAWRHKVSNGFNLVRIHAEDLALQSASPHLVAVENAMGDGTCETLIDLDIGCDGHAYVSTSRNYDPWPQCQVGGTGAIRRVALSDGRRVAEIGNNHFLGQLALTCRPQEVLGVDAPVEPGPYRYRLFQAPPGSPMGLPGVIEERYGYSGPHAVMPGGTISMDEPLTGVVSLRTTVPGCSFPGVVTSLPFCPASLVILPETPDSRVAGDDQTPITVYFRSPSPVDLATVRLEVTLLGVGNYTPMIGEVGQDPQDATRYSFLWSGPWVYTDTSGAVAPLPTGSLNLTVHASEVETGRDLFSPRYPLVIAESPLEILPSTTRWKPQRDDSTDILIHFRGPSDLAVESVGLEVNPPAGGPLAYAPTWTLPTMVPGGVDEYVLRWTGPWTFDGGSGAQPLPVGDYEVRVVSAAAGQPIRSGSYSRISLVEVTSVTLTGNRLDTDPPMPLTADEMLLVSGRKARPGGGWRIFAEADRPFAGPDPSSPVHDEVTVSVEISPTLDADVSIPVYLRALDVADPDALPPGLGEGVHDNFESASLPEAVDVLADTNAASATLRVSHKPGDNYRVLASTSREWLAEARAVASSLSGEVQDADGSLLPESRDKVQAQLSRMLTVWRTLHLEIDSMMAEPSAADAKERNFIEGKVKEIRDRRRFLLEPESPEGMDRLGDRSKDAGPPPQGAGRFEGGTLRLGSEGTDLSVGSNGLEFVELNHSILVRLLDAADNAFCNARLNSGLGNTFDIAPLSVCTWDPARAVTVEIAGNPYPVVQVGQLRAEGDEQVGTIEVGGIESLSVRLTDDDAPFTGAEPGIVDTSLLQDSDEPDRNVFAAAYIRPRRLANSNVKRAAFRRNIDCPGTRSGQCGIQAEAVPALNEGRERDDLAATISNSYWSVYLQGAFQGDDREDEDPSGEGLTLGLKVGYWAEYGAFIFTEAMREAGGDCSAQTPPHELGHQLGLVDDEYDLGIMGPCRILRRNAFLPAQLRTMRETGVLVPPAPPSSTP